MPENVKNIANKAKSKINEAAAAIKGKFYDLTGIPSITVKEIADFIKLHPGSTVTTKSLLGNTYTFYYLDIDGNRYFLETNGSHILQLDAHTPEHSIVCYRSYRDVLNDPIKLHN
jgi:hypothetical protein